MNGNHYSIRLPERGTISEVIVHSGYPEGRRVIKLDPPLRVEPGATVTLSLTPAATQTVIEEKQLCSMCSRLMILVETNVMYGRSLLDRVTILSEELRKCAEQGGVPRKVLAQALGDAYLDGLRSYAWWHDGHEVLGSCHTTYKSVADQVCREIQEATR